MASVLGAAALVAAAASAAEAPPPGAPASLGGAYPWALDLDRTAFDAFDAAENSDGRQLVDLEVRWDGTEERFWGRWRALSGTVHELIQGDLTDWEAYLAAVAPLAGRFLDVEVGSFGGATAWSALFLEDGNDLGFAVRTDVTDSDLHGSVPSPGLLEEHLRAGWSVVDFEAWLDGAAGDEGCGAAIDDASQRFAVVWAQHDTQPRTHLYYGLESADVTDLLSPLAGRVIDLERYCSPLHDEIRWALVVAQYPGGEWAHLRDLSSTQLESAHDANADADTVMVDLEVWADGAAGWEYAGVWGDDEAALHEVAAVAAAASTIDLDVALVELIDCYELGIGDGCVPSGKMGIFGLNLRTGQALGYRADEPFYLASTTKLAVHLRLWDLFEQGEMPQMGDDCSTVEPGELCIAFTDGPSSRSPWYMEDRSTPGFDCTLFGQAFNLDRYDRAMMQSSDNAATSALVDDPTLGLANQAAVDGLTLNEWLSGLEGVGQGWGVVTSIADVDRGWLWQAQVVDRPTEPSFFLVDPHRFEPFYRCDTDPSCPGVLETPPFACDYWGELDEIFAPSSGVNPYRDDGLPRYFRMGLNSATPRAAGELMARFGRGDLLSGGNTMSALANMKSCTTGGAGCSPIASHALFRAGLSERTKPGDKGRSTEGYGAHNDLSILFFGPAQASTDAVVLGVFVRDDSLDSAPRNTLFGEVGLAAFRRLTPNLAPCSSSSLDRPAVRPGQALEASCGVPNAGGADTGPFDVELYLSVDATWDGSDRLLDTIPGELPGDVGGLFFADAVFPDDVAPGTYFLIWKADRAGAVDEWNEDDNEHTMAETVIVRAGAVVPLLSLGDVVDEVGAIESLGLVEVGDDGHSFVWVTTTAATNEDVLLRDGALFLREGDVMPGSGGAVLRLGGPQFDAAADGSLLLVAELFDGSSVFEGLFFLPPDVDEPTAADLVLLAIEGGPAPADTAPGSLITGFGYPELRRSTLGTWALVSVRVDDPAINGFVLYRWELDDAGDLVASDRVAAEGEVLSGHTDPVSGFGARHGLSLDERGDALYRVFTTGAEAVYRWSASSVLVAKEGSPSPVAGRSWSNLDQALVHRGRNGLYLTGRLDGDTGTDELMVRSGVALRQEGDPLISVDPDTPPILTGFEEAPIGSTDGGTSIWKGGWSDGVDPTRKGYFLGSTVVLMELETEVDGAGLILSIVNNEAISDDGRYLIFEALYDPAPSGAPLAPLLGSTRGVFLVDLREAIFRDGFEGGTLGRWVAVP